MILPGATGDVVTGRWIEAKFGRPLLANHDDEIGAKVSNLGDPPWEDWVHLRMLESNFRAYGSARSSMLHYARLHRALLSWAKLGWAALKCAELS